MNSKLPEMPTIRVSTFKNRSLSITLASDYLFRINTGPENPEGTTLVELGSVDPTAAYAYLRVAIGNTAIKNAAYITGDKTTPADSGKDDEGNVRQVAAEVMDKFLPPVHEGPFNVSVYVAASKADKALGIKEPIKLMDLAVEPPNLAF